MPLWRALVLGVVQGIAGFLPISSSGHLLAVPWVFRWNDFAGDPAGKQTFDVALHLGTLGAVTWYFRQDLRRLARAAWTSLRARRVSTFDEALVWRLALATVPAVIVGGLFDDWISEHLGGPVSIGLFLLAGSGLLWIADRNTSGTALPDSTTADTVTMGVAQAIALAPGVSRSGVTMAAGRLRGLDRASAARLSFLLAIPVTAGAGALKTAEALSAGIPGELLGAFAVGIVASAGTGVAAIAFLMKRISGRGFRPYIVYRMGAGLTLLALAIVRR